jgi:hypothetical protein
MLASSEVIKRNAESGDGKVHTVYKIKLWDKSVPWKCWPSTSDYFGRKWTTWER